MIENILDIKILIPAVTSLVAGAWVLKDFLIKRELYPRPKIESGMKIIRSSSGRSDKNIALIWIKIKNSGIARLYIDEGSFFIRHLPYETDFKMMDIGGIPMVDFPIKAVETTHLFPKDWKYSYVDGGGETEYRFTAAIPSSKGIYSIHSKISLRENRSDFIQDVSFYKLQFDNKFEKIRTAD